MGGILFDQYCRASFDSEFEECGFDEKEMEVDSKKIRMIEKWAQNVDVIPTTHLVEDPFLIYIATWICTLYDFRALEVDISCLSCPQNDYVSAPAPCIVSTPVAPSPSITDMSFPTLYLLHIVVWRPVLVTATSCSFLNSLRAGS